MPGREQRLRSRAPPGSTFYRSVLVLPESEVTCEDRVSVTVEIPQLYYVPLSPRSRVWIIFLTSARRAAEGRSYFDTYEYHCYVYFLEGWADKCCDAPAFTAL